MHLLLRLIISLLWRICIVAASSSDKVSPIAGSGCETHCGDVSIPYPFGIGPSSNCYLYDWFEIDCNNSTSGPKLLLKNTKIEMLDISVEGALRVKYPVMFFNRKMVPQLPNFTGSPFVYSHERNKFTAVSCGFFALVRECVNNVWYIKILSPVEVQQMGKEGLNRVASVPNNKLSNGSNTCDDYVSRQNLRNSSNGIVHLWDNSTTEGQYAFLKIENILRKLAAPANDECLTVLVVSS
ncbi:hypothetical protein ACFX15_045179 [Malus domestica]